MFLFTCFISFFLWRLYKWSQIDFNLQKEEGREVKIFNDMYTSSDAAASRDRPGPSSFDGPDGPAVTVAINLNDHVT